MTIQTLITIIIVFWTIVFVGAFTVITYILGKRSVINRPDKSAVFCLVGNEMQGFKGKKIRETDKGTAYLYNKNKIAIYPKKYKHDIFFKNMRVMFSKHPNQVITSPFDKDVELTKEEKSDLIYEILSGHIGSDAVKAVKKKGQPNIILVAIVAFIIGIIVVVGFTSFQDAIKQRQQPAVTTPTQNNELPFKEVK